MSGTETRERYIQIARAMERPGATRERVAKQFGVSRQTVGTAIRASLQPPPQPKPEPGRPGWSVPDADTLRECRLAREEAERHPSYKYKPDLR